MIQLQNRDREVLKLCYQHQFLTSEHVKSFFPGYWGESYRRIRELAKAGFVEKHYHPVAGTKTLIRLTQLGVSTALQTEGCQELSYLRKLNPNTLVHDALVTSVRLRLAPVWNAAFLPERAIKKSVIPEIPDGVFVFPSKKGLALEIENSDKGRTRFHKLLSRWKDHPFIGAVLYVAATPELYRILTGYLNTATLSVNPLIGLVSWEVLQAGLPAVITQIGSVNLFAKRELFQ